MNPVCGGDVGETTGDVALRCPSGETEGEGIIFLLTEGLTDLENKINTNSVIYAFEMFDTRVNLCTI